MKILPLLFALLLLCAGCSDSSSVAPQTEPDVIMALKPGNRWIGLHTAAQQSRYDTLRIDTDTMIGAERWHRAVSSSSIVASRPDLVHESYLINRADGLYAKSLRLGGSPSATRFVKYPVAIGDTAIDYGWFRVTYQDGSLGPMVREFGLVTALGEQVTVPAGSYTGFRVDFKTVVDPIDSTGFAPAYDRAWFAPRVGLLRAVRYGDTGTPEYSWELIGLTLN